MLRGNERNGAPLVLSFLPQAYCCKASTLSALTKGWLLQHTGKIFGESLLNGCSQDYTVMNKAETRGGGRIETVFV
jgi:hypothetical protein